MKDYTKFPQLTSSQLSDQNFLTSLATALQNKDFSGMNFRTYGHCTPGGMQYSLMCDNFQIWVVRTGVYYYPTLWRKITRNGEWLFQPDQFERYEIYVNENKYPMHVQESNELMHGGYYLHGVGYRNYNNLFMDATMATNRGFYLTHCFDERPRRMFFDQNPHLFAPAQQLFSIMDAQRDHVLDKPITDYTPYQLLPFSRTLSRANLLTRIQALPQRQK